MKKSIAIIALLCVILSLPAQRRKPAYIEVELGGGFTSFPYDKGKKQFVRGGVFDIGARYSLLFNGREGWGISTGLGFSTFQGGIVLNENYAFPAIDSEGDPYELRVKVQNWNERQHIYYINIPLSVFYQQKPRLGSGWITSLGLKLYMPLAGSYNVPTGGLTTAGYYEQWGGTLLENLPQHGFGYYEGFNPKGKIKANFLVSAQFLFGGIIHIDRKNEAFIAGYIEHGFYDMINPNKDVPLFRSASQDLGKFTGEYSGYYLSSMSQNTIPLMIGVRIGWRFKDIHKCNCIR